MDSRSLTLGLRFGFLLFSLFCIHFISLFQLHGFPFTLSHTLRWTDCFFIDGLWYLKVYGPQSASILLRSSRKFKSTVLAPQKQTFSKWWSDWKENGGKRYTSREWTHSFRGPSFFGDVCSGRTWRRLAAVSPGPQPHTPAGYPTWEVQLLVGLAGPCITSAGCWKQAAPARFFKPNFLQVGDEQGWIMKQELLPDSTSLITKKHLQNKWLHINCNSQLITMQMYMLDIIYLHLISSRDLVQHLTNSINDWTSFQWKRNMWHLVLTNYFCYNVTWIL